MAIASTGTALATPQVMVLGEVFGRDRGRAGWQFGPRLNLLDEAVAIDLILGRNVAVAPATWLIIGITFRFAAP